MGRIDWVGDPWSPSDSGKLKGTFNQRSGWALEGLLKAAGAEGEWRAHHSCTPRKEKTRLKIGWAQGGRRIKRTKLMTTRMKIE